MPGFEKFNTVQNVLDQNKCALPISPTCIPHLSNCSGNTHIRRRWRNFSLCRILINEINANHEARTPEGLARNVVLIKEAEQQCDEGEGRLSHSLGLISSFRWRCVGLRTLPGLRPHFLVTA